MLREKILLIGIVLLALLLRFWQLGVNPPSLNWDETAWGYNAYSLGIDARDEFGVFLPYKYLESFGDFKPPLYAYLDVLPVKLFGLNEFAVRFPSAMFGSLTVMITYFLVLKLFFDNKYKKNIALLAAFFLAVSPWHINLSRAAFEANVAQFFLVAGIYFFLVGIKKKWILILSVTSFALSLYTFNTSRIVAPLLGIMLVVGFYKAILKHKKESIIAGLCGIVLILPLAGFLVSSQANLRFREVNIFSDITIIRQTNQEIANDQNSSLSKVLHNRRLAYGVSYIKHYLDLFNPNFLFITGDQNIRFSTWEVGELYILDLPLLIIGAFLLLRKRFGYWWIIPLWLVLGIIPAATARETPHALRTETVLPLFQILAAVGAAYGMGWMFRLKHYAKPAVVLFFSLYTLCIVYYLQGYYRDYSRESSKDWQFGYKESVNYVHSVQNNYKEIDITTDLGRPYIYYLFYLHTNPEEFRKTASVRRDSFGFVHIDGFNSYKFKDILDTHPRSGVLYIQLAEKVPPGAHLLKAFKLLDGSAILKAYTL